MIFTDRTITVRKGESRIDEPIVVYRGDYELEVRFTILNSRFKFMSGTNMIESEKASYGQLAILTPYGGNIFSDIVRCNDGSVTFVLTAEMLNQIEEVGLYSFQIRLMDYNKESRVSIPPIEYGIEVREPIASEDHDNSVNNAIVGYSIAKVVDPKEENVGDTFYENGDYNKTRWVTGDRISEGKLNKIEDAIDKVNRNEKDNTAALSKRIDNNFNVLDATKADKNEIFTMANMGQDVKEAMTGGSVAVVGKNAVGNINIIDASVDMYKIAPVTVRDIVQHSNFINNGYYFDDNGVLKQMDGWCTTEPINHESGTITMVVSSSSYAVGIWVDEDYKYTESIKTTDVTEAGVFDGRTYYSMTIRQPGSISSRYLMINYSPLHFKSIELTFNGSVRTEHVCDEAITSSKLSRDVRIKNFMIEDDSIDGSKISKLTLKDIFEDVRENLEYINTYMNTNGVLMSAVGWSVTKPILFKKDGYFEIEVSSAGYIVGSWFDDNYNYTEGAYINPKYNLQLSDGWWKVRLSNPTNSRSSYIRINCNPVNIRHIYYVTYGSISGDHIAPNSITADKLAFSIDSIKKDYVDSAYTRSSISGFLDDWNERKMLNVVCIGDSITNYQNSNTLPMSEQMESPLGLQGDSWVRRLWKMLNYNVYNDDRSIKNENGNLEYKRYDHPDFEFTGGYQGSSSSVGAYKWATNRSDTNDSWRNKSHGGYPQIITNESSYNKMMVGSMTAGATCSVKINKNAIGMAIVFGACACTVRVLINDGVNDIFNNDITLNNNAYELHKEFELTPGSDKNVTITLISGEVWIYGIESWNDNCVRVVNGGLAGCTVDAVANSFDLLFNCFNGDKNNVDLVVWEVNALNDARELLSKTRTNAKKVFDKLSNMNVEVLLIIPHRHESGGNALQYDRYNPIYGDTLEEGSPLVGYKTFYPDYARLYKTLGYKYEAGIIDMFSKSVDICGGLHNDAQDSFPIGFFIDGIHLGDVGNESYEEELRKVFMWEDYD